ncbi:MAG: hypothetical protein B7Y95_22615 [Rhizobiales bacterium 32-66-11]|nr:MAG: hypothetical protein B7Y95_22615 [Rhizobiales bacterium 32-66-11]
MLFDLTALAADVRYKLLTATVTPRPIAWITTRSREGIDNAAPFSFFNVMGHEPATVAIGLLRNPRSGLKDTAHNILATGEFIAHLVPERMAAAMNATSAEVPAEVDELRAAGLRVVPGDMVAASRIADCPVAFECRAISSVVTGPDQVAVIAQVLCAHIADAHILDAGRGHVDTPSLDLISRMHGAGWYARSTDLFELARPQPASRQAEPVE